MKNSQAILSFFLGNLLLVSSYPRGPCGTCGDNSGGGSGYPPAPPSPTYPPPSGGIASSDSQSFAPVSDSQISSASLTPGGNLPPPGPSGGSSCQVTESSPGNYKVTCAPPTATIQSEHVLWLTNDGSKPQVIDIEVPNYKIQELIKAGFKEGAQGSSSINVLLKKPETSVDAQVDTPKSAQGPPKVSIQYEQGSKQLIHFPNDKPYSPLSGPILPPLAGGSGPRPQRQILQRPFQHFVAPNNFQRY